MLGMRWKNCKIRPQVDQDIERQFTSGDGDLDAVDFYLKNGFSQINSTIDPDRHTVPMYFDLADLTIDEA